MPNFVFNVLNQLYYYFVFISKCEQKNELEIVYVWFLNSFLFVFQILWLLIFKFLNESTN